MLNGPSYFNFTDITTQLLAKEAVIICNDSDEVSLQLERLFQDQNLQKQMGKSALEVVKANQGAVEKTLSAIHPYLS